MRRGLTLFAVVGAIVAAPAGAEEKADSLAERKVMQSFGECAVKRDAAGARRAVVEDLPYRDIAQQHKALVSPDCLPGASTQRQRLRFDEAILKAVLAEALFHQELAAQGVADFAAVPRLTHREPWPVTTTDKKTGKPLPPKAIAAQEAAVARKLTEMRVAMLGECVVRKDPAGARAILLTPLGGDEEMAALRALAPVAATCVVAGQQVRFDRLTLRSAVATNYYRLASATLADKGR